MLQFRLESKQSKDSRSLLDWQGKYRIVQITEYEYSNYGIAPVYGELNFSTQNPYIVSPTKACNFWASIQTPSQVEQALSTEKLKLVSTWLPRIASKMSSLFIGEKHPSAILILVHFKSFSRTITENITAEDAEKNLDFVSFSAETTSNTLRIQVDEGFEKALYHPNNIAEKTLVSKVLEGLRDTFSLDFDIVQMVNDIVENNKARHSHAFLAESFRHSFQDTLPKSPVFPNKLDEGLVRFMLGWNHVGSEYEARTTGRLECRNLLRKIIAGLEQELVTSIRQYDPQSFLNTIVANHESAICYSDNWKRTTAC
jgi:hypothetical protein